MGATRLDFTFDVAGLAGHARGVFELVVIGLDLRSGDAPVLQRHVGRDEVLAVALLVLAANAQFVIRPAPVTPFQCTPAPPTPSPGRNEPSLRIGSAVSAGLLRMV